MIWFGGSGPTFRLCQVTAVQILENRVQVLFMELSALTAQFTSALFSEMSPVPWPSGSVADAEQMGRDIHNNLK